MNFGTSLSQNLWDREKDLDEKKSNYICTKIIIYLFPTGGGRTTRGMGGGTGTIARCCCLFSLRCINLMSRSIRERRRRLALLSISRVEETYELRVTRNAEETWTSWKTSSGGILAPAIIISSGKVGTTRGSLIFILQKPLFFHKIKLNCGALPITYTCNSEQSTERVKSQSLLKKTNA